MRARLRQFRAWYNSPQVSRAIRLGLVSIGLTTLHGLLKEQEERLEHLEERGLAPLDDFVTVGDLNKVDDRLRVLEGKPPRSDVVDVDALGERATEDVPAGPHGAGNEGTGVEELE